MTSNNHATRRTQHVSWFLRHWRLGVILFIYLLAATAHSLIAPLTVGNDEWAHFLYVRFIAEHGRLPQTTAERDLAGYKADAPALYHLLVAAVTAPVEPTRLLRPLDRPRRYLADNIIDSYALVHTAVENLPYRGEVLLWHLGRGVSIVFGLVLIIVTYATGLTIFPQNYRRAALASALVAFIPAVLFHSSVLTYESLSATLTALFLWAGVKALQRPRRQLWWLALGLLAGLALTTKYSALLLPLEILFLAGLVFWRHQERRLSLFISRVLIAGVALILAAGWWFGFVAWHFNTIATQGPVVGLLQPLLVGDASDTTSVQVAGFLFGQHAVAASVRQPLPRHYGLLLQSLLESFWAAPVAGRFVLSPWLPFFFSGLALLGLAGLVNGWRRANRQTRPVLLLLVFHAALILPLLAVRVVLSYDPREVAQGRHILLPAASAIAILLVWGWQQWRPRLAGLIVAGVLAWGLLGQVVWAALVYPPPIPVWPSQAAPPAPASPGYDLTGAVRLRDVAWQFEPDSLHLTLWWEALDPAPQDYLVELTLTDASGRLVGYRLAHPVDGRYPTRAWEPGDVVRDEVRLPLLPSPDSTFTLALRLGTRQLEPASESVVLELAGKNVANPPAGCSVFGDTTGLRPNASVTVVSLQPPRLDLLTTGGGVQSLPPLVSNGPFHSYIVGPDWPANGKLFAGDSRCAELTFDIPPRNFTAPDIPQPLPVNFNNEIELLGYDLPTHRIDPGQRLPLTLYWRGLAYMGQDYRIFANPLDDAQQRWGGYDRRPRDGYSTLRWVPGEVITDPFGIPIDPDAPPGIYTIDLGWYQETAQGAASLPVFVEGQPTEQTSVRLGPIKIGGPPPEVVTVNPQPQHTIDQQFGGQITLLGYDVASQRVSESANGESVNSPNSLTLKLYWRADTVPAADYTTFLHLRDAAGQNVAQKDQPPAAGRYPTSLWDAGEVVIDTLVLPLDRLPPGEYTPVVGLYQLSSGVRLTVPGHPANEIALDQLTINNK